MSHDTSRSWEWQPDTPTLVTWNVIGLGLVIVGVIAFTGLYAVTHEGDAGYTFSGGGALWAMLVTLLLVAVLMVLHECIHGLTMRCFGARPAYGVGVAARMVPFAYCTAPGHRFEKRQFLIVSLAPCVIVSTVCAVGIMLPVGGWVVLPAAVHLGGCIGDLWMSMMVAGKPDDMRFEDSVTGVRFHRPASGGASPMDSCFQS